MGIRDIENLTTPEYLAILINYLAVLQDGRTKPDTKGGGYIRESVYNIDEIEEVKNEINNILRINIAPKSIEFVNKTKNNYFNK